MLTKGNTDSTHLRVGDLSHLHLPPSQLLELRLAVPLRIQANPNVHRTRNPPLAGAHETVEIRERQRLFIYHACRSKRESEVIFCLYFLKGLRYAPEEVPQPLFSSADSHQDLSLQHEAGT